MFQIVAGEASYIHPMAFSFPTRSPDRIVFPTIHVHDGEVHARADFDHRLFCQQDELGEIPRGQALPSLQGWGYSYDLPESSVDISRTGGLVAEFERCYRMTMWGIYDNEDVTVDLSAIRADVASFWEKRAQEEKEIDESN